MWKNARSAKIVLMNKALFELKKCRERWTKAKEANDRIMMRLWEKMGKRLKKQIKQEHFKNSVKS